MYNRGTSSRVYEVLVVAAAVVTKLDEGREEVERDDESVSKMSVESECC